MRQTPGWLESTRQQLIVLDKFIMNGENNKFKIAEILTSIPWKENTKYTKKHKMRWKRQIQICGKFRTLTEYIREVKIPRFRCTGTSSDVSSCFTDVCNSIIPVFCFLAIDNDIMRKMCTLITSKGTDIDENIANQNHATRHVHRNRGILTSLILAS
jgi:hypothetical protein